MGEMGGMVVGGGCTLKVLNNKRVMHNVCLQYIEYELSQQKGRGGFGFGGWGGGEGFVGGIGLILDSLCDIWAVISGEEEGDEE